MFLTANIKKHIKNKILFVLGKDQFHRLKITRIAKIGQYFEVFSLVGRIRSELDLKATIMS